MIREFNGHKPDIDPTAFVHETADVSGKVIIKKDASIWPYCVLRGDVEEIIIGEGSNVQDNTVIHTNYGKPTTLGSGVTVGHSVVLHGCTVKDNCLIGIGSIVLDDVVVEEECIVGAGAVVSPKTVVPRGAMAIGIPARITRHLRPDEIEHIKWNAKEYITLKETYKNSSRKIQTGS